MSKNRGWDGQCCKVWHAAAAAAAICRGHIIMVPGSRIDSLMSLCGSTMAPLRYTSSCRGEASGHFAMSSHTQLAELSTASGLPGPLAQRETPSPRWLAWQLNDSCLRHAALPQQGPTR